MNLRGLIILFKQVIIASMLTLNSLSFSIHSSPRILAVLGIRWVSYGFPIPWLFRVLSSYAGMEPQFDYWTIGFGLFWETGVDLGLISFILDLIFWLVVAHFALRFLRVRKLPLPRDKLIVGTIIFASESFWIAFPDFHRFFPIFPIFIAFFLEALLGGTLMIAGFFYILSVVRLGEAKEEAAGKI